MFKGQLLIFFIIYIHSSSGALEIVCDAGRAIWKFHLMTEKMSLVNRYDAFQLYKHQVDEIHHQLRRIENSIDSKIISNSFKSMPYPITLYKALDTLEIFILTVDQYYDNFRQKIDEMTDTSYDLQIYIESVISDIEEKMKIIRKKVLDEPEFWEYDLIHGITSFALNEQPQFCHSPRILSADLLRLFKTIVIAEVKASVMAAAVNYSHPSHTNSPWANDLSRETFRTQIGIYVKLFSTNVLFTDEIYIKACEPHRDHWKRDESFYELEGTLQTAIFRYDSEKCDMNECYSIWYSRRDQCKAQYNDIRTACFGRIADCSALNAIQACVLKNGPYKYLYVNSTEKGLFGRSSECPDSDSYMMGNGNDWSSSDRACACTCHENDNSIGLFIMESNITSNMVITGLRFIRQNGMLYIQPKEGKLYSYGRIRRYPERWIPIPANLSVSQIHPINKDNRIFFFDSVYLPTSFVLTGIKFERVQRKLITGFAIVIFGVPFNFETGELNSYANSVISKQESNRDPGEPLLFLTRNPANVDLPLTPSPGNKKYVSLERSNLRDDFGQSTLPLFDAVPVITSPPFPLGGVGIFHKGTDGYAGFISLRVYGIKYANFFVGLSCVENKTVVFY